MSRFNFERTFYCERCERQVKILHEHTTRLTEIEPPPPRLPPGWSTLPEDEIDRLLKERL